MTWLSCLKEKGAKNRRPASKAWGSKAMAEPKMPGLLKRMRRVRSRRSLSCMSASSRVAATVSVTLAVAWSWALIRPAVDWASSAPFSRAMSTMVRLEDSKA
ncbi:hypothetical protein DSECCO2_651550 [anaerobic digester metagenome]